MTNRIVEYVWTDKDEASTRASAKRQLCSLLEDPVVVAGIAESAAESANFDVSILLTCNEILRDELIAWCKDGAMQ